MDMFDAAATLDYDDLTSKPCYDNKEYLQTLGGVQGPLSLHTRVFHKLERDLRETMLQKALRKE